jgi:hydroxypyruvate reductase
MISDVPGDNPSVIASGPTVADSSTFEDARRIVAHYGIDLPPAVAAHLEAARDETPKKGDVRLSRTENHIVAAPQRSLEAAATVAETSGYQAMILGDAIEGEARDVAKVLAAIARQVQRHGQPGKPPLALISGGETTVTVRGDGRGGRNVELLLAMAMALDDADAISAIAGDTDGIDGAGPAAGALIDPTTLERSRAAGLDAPSMLVRNDAMRFFETLGDCVVTGPTLTNVNDFRAVLIDG